MKKRIVTAMIVLILLLLTVFPSAADEIESRENGLDVMFVIDASGSMKSNDRNNTALEMVKAFVDTVHIENIRIGFVSYNDRIVSSVPPGAVSETEEREKLKLALDSIVYSGNTDIGLGLSYAHSLMNQEEGRNRVMVLISDGETDLGNTGTGRTLQQSNLELEETVRLCQEEQIPVYTIAFGTYDGNKAVLEQMSNNTGAMAYTAGSPESLIEVFYGIFADNLSYKIQQVTNSVYAKGDQEIRYILDEMYLDELDLLLISPGRIGETAIYYGDRQAETKRLYSYAVGKIRDLDPNVNELTVKTATTQGQSLKAYLISYRSLTPVLEIGESAERNDIIPYQVYFKDRNGTVIRDEAFYKKFQWDIEGGMQEDASVQEGIIMGKLSFDRSGDYSIKASLKDSLGSYEFAAMLQIVNTPPSGSLPDRSYTILSPEATFDLGAYFKDSNGDSIQYTIEQGESTNAKITLNGAVLTVKPERSGSHALTLFISDGEDTLAYPYQVKVTPLWQAYWWALVIIALVAGILLWKRFHKPKPELVQIIERKAQNRFSGKLDAYFTAQPEETEEIPPLTFPMYKMKVNKVNMGELMNCYPKSLSALGLDSIFLIADEDRRMILYHNSNALIMIGNSIVCRQLQYSVSFGDVIYITATDGTYEMEVHYIAMIQ